MNTRTPNISNGKRAVIGAAALLSILTVFVFTTVFVLTASAVGAPGPSSNTGNNPGNANAGGYGTNSGGTSSGSSNASRSGNTGTGTRGGVSGGSLNSGGTGGGAGSARGSSGPSSGGGGSSRPGSNPGERSQSNQGGSSGLGGPSSGGGGAGARDSRSGGALTGDARSAQSASRARAGLGGTPSGAGGGTAAQRDIGVGAVPGGVNRLGQPVGAGRPASGRPSNQSNRRDVNTNNRNIDALSRETYSGPPNSTIVRTANGYQLVNNKDLAKTPGTRIVSYDENGQLTPEESAVIRDYRTRLATQQIDRELGFVEDPEERALRNMAARLPYAVYEPGFPMEYNLAPYRYDELGNLIYDPVLNNDIVHFAPQNTISNLQPRSANSLGPQTYSPPSGSVVSRNRQTGRYELHDPWSDTTRAYDSQKAARALSGGLIPGPAPDPGSIGIPVTTGKLYDYGLDDPRIDPTIRELRRNVNPRTPGDQIYDPDWNTLTRSRNLVELTSFNTPTTPRTSQPRSANSLGPQTYSPPTGFTVVRNEQTGRYELRSPSVNALGPEVNTAPSYQFNANPSTRNLSPRDVQALRNIESAYNDDISAISRYRDVINPTDLNVRNPNKIVDRLGYQLDDSLPSEITKGTIVRDNKITGLTDANPMLGFISPEYAIRNPGTYDPNFIRDVIINSPDDVSKYGVNFPDMAYPPRVRQFNMPEFTPKDPYRYSTPEFDGNPYPEDFPAVEPASFKTNTTGAFNRAFAPQTRPLAFSVNTSGVNETGAPTRNSRVATASDRIANFSSIFGNRSSLQNSDLGSENSVAPRTQRQRGGTPTGQLRVEPASIEQGGNVTSVRLSGMDLGGEQLKGAPVLTRIDERGSTTRLRWNGNDESASTLSPGEYAYRLRYKTERCDSNSRGAFCDVERWHNLVGTLYVSPRQYQCSDGVDNDSDGKIDFLLDPGCSTARDNSEGDTCSPRTGERCLSAPNNSCSPAARNTGVVQCDGSCSAQRPVQCDAPNISCPVNFTGFLNSRGRAQVQFNGGAGVCQNIIRINNTCDIVWRANKGTSCSVTGPGINRADLGLSGTITTGPLASTTMYTVTCKNGETTVVSKNFTCRVLDQVREN